MAPLAGGAWAARSGGRIGGAGFSAARSGAGSFGGSMAGGMSRGYGGGVQEFSLCVSCRVLAGHLSLMVRCLKLVIRLLICLHQS